MKEYYLFIAVICMISGGFLVFNAIANAIARHFIERSRKRTFLF